MKLKEIKDILNALTDDQLEQTAHLMGVDEPGFDVSIEISSDSLLLTDDGLQPPWPGITEEERAEYPQVWPAGSVFFYKELGSPKFEVRPSENGFRVYNIADNVAISHACPEDVANEICSDFNKMSNGDFSPLENYEDSL